MAVHEHQLTGRGAGVTGHRFGVEFLGEPSSGGVKLVLDALAEAAHEAATDSRGLYGLLARGEPVRQVPSVRAGSLGGAVLHLEQDGGQQELEVLDRGGGADDQDPADAATGIVGAERDLTAHPLGHVAERPGAFPAVPAASGHGVLVQEDLLPHVSARSGFEVGVFDLVLEHEHAHPRESGLAFGVGGVGVFGESQELSDLLNLLGFVRRHGSPSVRCVRDERAALVRAARGGCCIVVAHPAGELCPVLLRTARVGCRRRRRGSAEPRTSAASKGAPQR